ncbi:MAG: hypothetical protein PHV82_01300 [Victivallaceae bacterium]|nr:hypothetical protein [Victivallaceae bacterium]
MSAVDLKTRKNQPSSQESWNIIPGKTASDRLAAEELKKYICRATGVEMPVLDAPECAPFGNAVYVGMPEFHAGIAALLREKRVSIPAGSDGFAVKTVQAHSCQRVIITGGTVAGMFRGVYRLLEDRAGFTAFPATSLLRKLGIDHERINRTCNIDSIFSGLDIAGHSLPETRGIHASNPESVSTNLENAVMQLDWMSKNGLNAYIVYAGKLARDKLSWADVRRLADYAHLRGIAVYWLIMPFPFCGFPLPEEGFEHILGYRKSFLDRHPECADTSITYARKGVHGMCPLRVEDMNKAASRNFYNQMIAKFIRLNQEAGIRPDGIAIHGFDAAEGADPSRTLATLVNLTSAVMDENGWGNMKIPVVTDYMRTGADIVSCLLPGTVGKVIPWVPFSNIFDGGAAGYEELEERIVSQERNWREKGFADVWQWTYQNFSGFPQGGGYDKCEFLWNTLKSIAAAGRKGNVFQSRFEGGELELTFAARAMWSGTAGFRQSVENIVKAFYGSASAERMTAAVLLMDEVVALSKIPDTCFGWKVSFQNIMILLEKFSAAEIKRKYDLIKRKTGQAIVLAQAASGPHCSGAAELFAVNARHYLFIAELYKKFTRLVRLSSVICSAMRRGRRAKADEAMVKAEKLLAEIKAYCGKIGQFYSGIGGNLPAAYRKYDTEELPALYKELEFWFRNVVPVKNCGLDAPLSPATFLSKRY